MEIGSATPIAYDTWTKQRRQIFALTNDLATQRAAYAAERSTFVKSLPENAPPPCAPQPPYVSTMIFRPVKPASPYCHLGREKEVMNLRFTRSEIYFLFKLLLTIGPPIMNSPHGLTWTIVFASKYCSGMTVLITLSITSLRNCSNEIFSECWSDTTTVWTRFGKHAPLSNKYSHVTYDQIRQFKWKLKIE